jgi:hypothetical protein
MKLGKLLAVEVPGVAWLGFCSCVVRVLNAGIAAIRVGANPARSCGPALYEGVCFGV